MSEKIVAGLRVIIFNLWFVAFCQRWTFSNWITQKLTEGPVAPDYLPFLCLFSKMCAVKVSSKLSCSFTAVDGKSYYSPLSACSSIGTAEWCWAKWLCIFNVSPQAGRQQASTPHVLLCSSLLPSIRRPKWCCWENSQRGRRLVRMPGFYKKNIYKNCAEVLDLN